MAINKSNGAVATPLVAEKSETAPVTRKLNTGTETENTKSGGRDYNVEARGKVACAAFNAALSSPGLAGLGFTNYDEYMKFVKKAADESVAYTWEHQK